MIFRDFWVLFLIPIVLVGGFFISKRSKSASIRFSSLDIINNPKITIKLIGLEALLWLRLGAICLFLVALARPSSPIENAKVEAEGIDIVLAIDCSSSMLAEDFKLNNKRQNRLVVVKKVAQDFIEMRTNDKIGIIAFAARAYTVCPLTLDYPWLIKNLERIRIGDIEDGTAVGSAIMSSLNRLRDSQAKSKIIILLTDGVNNAGRVSPFVAAETAKSLGVKIYTVGAGAKGVAPYPARTAWGKIVYRNVEIEIDEDTLKEIAKETNGKYYRATDTRSLMQIYKEIDALEKTPVEDIGFTRYSELFPLFLIAALILLLLETTLSNTFLRRLP
ncbi:MAG: VWA domain-containing protein [Candidatus Orphnella occulta]|nr:VWA domain-containing protein [Candidatus Orphnella occulta]